MKRKKPSSRASPRTLGAPKPAPEPPPARPRPKWFRWVAALAIPIAVLLASEVGLRLAGYGYSTSFFKPLRRGDVDFLVENDRFGWRFFPPAVARTPAPLAFRAKKPPGTYRVFVLGESAALGDPRPAYGFSRYLEVLLRERFPANRFEVINLGMTALNSHGIREIARECARLEGDLWIVYLGNNEYYGPFGAGTLFGPQAPPLALVRARLALQTLRIGQWLAATTTRLRGTGAATTNWAGLRMFAGNEIPPDDPRREVVRDSFARNLEAIVGAGLRSGAKVILCSVAVNLRDSAPFASRHSRPLADSAREEWERRYRAAATAQDADDAAIALPVLRSLLETSPDYAEAQYRLATLELQGTNPPAAAARFSAARDTDAMPFRTDSRMNELGRQLAAKWASRGVIWLDAASELAPDAPAKVPGHELFYEHVHLTFDGNYRLARLGAGVVMAQLPKPITDQAGTDWASQEACERKLGLTDWNRAAVLEGMIGRLADAPYTNQLHSADRLRDLWAQLRDVRARQTPSARFEARPIYESAIQRAPDDHRLHENFAEFLEATGDLAAAAKEWERVHELIPHHLSGWYQEGRLLVALRQYPQARAALEHALQLRPDLVEAEIELVGIDAAEGQTAAALERCDRVLKRRPDEPRLYVRRADLLARLKRRDEATESLRTAIRVRPTFWEARYLLGVELAIDGQIPEAEAEFAEVVRLRPDHLLSRVNLGTALARQMRLDEAEVQFNEALRLDPLNQKALQSIEAIKALRPKIEMRKATVP